MIGGTVLSQIVPGKNAAWWRTLKQLGDVIVSASGSQVLHPGSAVLNRHASRDGGVLGTNQYLHYSVLLAVESCVCLIYVG